MKPIRKAVRTFLIDNNRVVAIKYTKDNLIDYYDIPGGKIEDNETAEEAAIREFKEETGMNIYDPQYAGNLIVEYPDRIYDLYVFIVSTYNGVPHKKFQNTSEWIEIDELLKKEKKFAEIYLLDELHYYDLLNITKFSWHFISDKNHKKINEIYYENTEKFWSEYYK